MFFSAKDQLRRGLGLDTWLWILEKFPLALSITLHKVNLANVRFSEARFST